MTTDKKPDIRDIRNSTISKKPTPATTQTNGVNNISGNYTQGDYYIYISQKARAVHGYIEKRSGESVGLFFGSYNSQNGRFTGRMKSIINNDYSRKGLGRFNFQVQGRGSSQAVRLSRRTGGNVTATKRPSINSQIMKLNKSIVPRNAADPIGYWTKYRGGNSSDRIYYFMQDWGRDSVIGISSFAMEGSPDHATYSTRMFVGSARMNSNRSQMEIRGLALPIGKGNSREYNAFISNTRGTEYTWETFDIANQGFAENIMRGVGSDVTYRRKDIFKRTYAIDLISITQLSSDACNNKNDYYAFTRFSPVGDPGGNNTKINWKLPESPGMGRAIGSVWSSGEPRVLRSRSGEDQVMSVYNEQSAFYFRLFVSDEDDFTCGQDDDPLDITPISGVGALLRIDYYGNVVLTTPDLRTQRRLGRIGDVLTIAGTTGDRARVQLRIRVPENQ